MLNSPIVRVSYADHAAKASPPELDGLDGETKARCVRHAVMLAPLQNIQLAMDQMVRNVETSLMRVRGEVTMNLDDIAKNYVTEEFKAIRSLVATLAIAAEAGKAMLVDMKGQIESIDSTVFPKPKRKSREEAAEAQA